MTTNLHFGTKVQQTDTLSHLMHTLPRSI